MTTMNQCFMMRRAGPSHAGARALLRTERLGVLLTRTRRSRALHLMPFNRHYLEHRLVSGLAPPPRATEESDTTPAPGDAPASASEPLEDHSADADAGGQADLAPEERLRRERISQANAGKTPWNKGRKHSPGTSS